jgi:hypothetical protein
MVRPKSLDNFINLDGRVDCCIAKHEFVTVNWPVKMDRTYVNELHVLSLYVIITVMVIGVWILALIFF